MRYKIHRNINMTRVSVAKVVTSATKSVEYMNLQAGL